LVPFALTVGMQFAKDVAVPLVIWDPRDCGRTPGEHCPTGTR
jgi:hypothetical protein